jgi:hypothetical protein
VTELAEVLLAEPIERRAVELRRPADVVVHAGLERCAVPVVPRVLRDVAVVDEHRLREPVLELSRQPAAALEEQDALARGCEVPRKGAAPGACSDHDHVVPVHGDLLPQLRDFRGQLVEDDASRGLDERQVRERLREVAEMACTRGLELLRIEPER